MNRLDPAAILHEDNHLLVISKAAGLLTQPVPGDSRDSLEELAKAYLKEKYHKPGQVFLHAVHRIDRQVSGLVIFARTGKALSRLNQAMRDKRITKTYQALVEGKPANEPGQACELHHYLRHGDHRAEVSDRPFTGGLEATLRYTLIGQGEGLALVRIDLETGRYHQIRAQFAHTGHPIVGDRRYGAQASFAPLDAIALHSYSATLPHPVGGAEITLTAPYPPEWQALAQGLI